MLKCSRSMSGGSRYWKAEPPSRPSAAGPAVQPPAGEFEMRHADCLTRAVFCLPVCRSGLYLLGAAPISAQSHANNLPGDRRATLTDSPGPGGELPRCRRPGL